MSESVKITDTMDQADLKIDKIIKDSEENSKIRNNLTYLIKRGGAHSELAKEKLKELFI